MNYHDTGKNEAGHTLAKWLADVLTEEVTALRMQTGYFRLEAVKALTPVLARIAEREMTMHLVIGSNDADTLHSEVSKLFAKLKMPRNNAKLAIVHFANALFHPKVYHITREDGSQAAFVGSANFTQAAITGGNVEAAISLDTRQGATGHVLNEIAEAVDNWLLDDPVPGSFRVSSQKEIDELLERGILSKQRPQREFRSSNTVRNRGGQPAACRPKLIVLPSWHDEEQEDVGTEVTDEDLGKREVKENSASPFVAVPADLPVLEVQEPDDGFELSVETRKGFPTYIQFEPGAEIPTSDWTALSGAKLTAPYVGLIMKLTKDSARHFNGGTGTANISIPVAVAKTFRFGVYPRSGRPRAEFSLRIRYHASTLNVEQSCNTNVMAYGVLPKDTGHGDLRMVLPVAVRKVAEEIARNEFPMPKSGDFFLLEWPSEDFDHFRITFLEPSCPEHKLAEHAYQNAAKANQLAGSSCGLIKDISPQW